MKNRAVVLAFVILVLLTALTPLLVVRGESTVVDGGPKKAFTLNQFYTTSWSGGTVGNYGTEVSIAFTCDEDISRYNASDITVTYVSGTSLVAQTPVARLYQAVDDYGVPMMDSNGQNIYVTSFILLPTSTQETLVGIYPINIRINFEQLSFVQSEVLIDNDNDPLTPDVSSTTTETVTTKYYQDFNIPINVNIQSTAPVDPTPTPEPTPSPTPKPQSIPRVMLTGYAIEPQQVEAGQSFDLSLTIKNQHSSQGVQNVKLTVTPDNSAVLPEGGSNTAYFSSMGAGEAVTQKFRFSTQPSIEVSAVNLAVEIAYDDMNAAPQTEAAALSVPVYQPVRLRMDPPQVYSYGPSEPISVSMAVYNLGRSTLYNLLATVEGEGLTPEGSYYGGNIEPGANKTVQLSVMARMDDAGGMEDYGTAEDDIAFQSYDGGGYEFEATDVAVNAVPVPAVEEPFYEDYIPASKDFYGEIVLTFEDANGKLYTETASFVTTVTEEYEMPVYDPGLEADVPVEPEKNLTWLWITLGGVAAAGVTVFLALRARKRRKMIEDELF